MNQILNTYQVHIGTAPWTVYYGFDPKTRQLKSWHIESTGIIEHPHYLWIFNHLPFREEDLVTNAKELFDGKSSRVLFMPESISFDQFWKRYANTLGNKKRAQKLWDLMPQTEQVAAYAFIETYNNFLRQNPSLTKAYPDTYLFQERWKN